VFSDRQLKRSGMDYLEHADIVRHESWTAFRATQRGRLILLTSKGAQPYCDFTFQAGDTLLLGRESAGVPQDVHGAADARLRIPLKPGLRSLNVAQAGAMVLGEALRQIQAFPDSQFIN
jgi:tRNA (cytidine/uridine-2'-O-)-methyltransferase